MTRYHAEARASHLIITQNACFQVSFYPVESGVFKYSTVDDNNLGTQHCTLLTTVSLHYRVSIQILPNISCSKLTQNNALTEPRSNSNHLYNLKLHTYTIQLYRYVCSNIISLLYSMQSIRTYYCSVFLRRNWYEIFLVF